MLLKMVVNFQILISEIGYNTWQFVILPQKVVKLVLFNDSAWIQNSFLWTTYRQCFELSFIQSQIWQYCGLDVGILGTQSPKYVRLKEITNWSL